jgi:hypothetical protein
MYLAVCAAKRLSAHSPLSLVDKCPGVIPTSAVAYFFSMRKHFAQSAERLPGQKSFSQLVIRKLFSGGIIYV